MNKVIAASAVTAMLFAPAVHGQWVPKPGMAMKSQPVDFNGRKFHQPGTIIGKALEPLESGLGEILVLLSMQ